MQTGSTSVTAASACEPARKKKLSLRTSVVPKIGTGVAVWEGTWEEAEAADMQDEREKEAREPSLEAAARRTEGRETAMTIDRIDCGPEIRLLAASLVGVWLSLAGCACSYIVLSHAS